MRLAFESCPLPAKRARQDEFARLLDEQGRQCGFADSGSGAADEVPSLHFLVIDVTPRATEPDGLRDELHRLLTGADSALERRIGEMETKANLFVRLLFVGATPWVDTWEDETEGRVSTKKSVEFYMRAFQKGGLAHYGSVVAPGAYSSVPEKGAFDPGHDGMQLAESAAIGLSRYYEPLPLAKFIERAAALRTANADLLDHALMTEPHLFGKDGGPAPSNDALMREIGALFQLGKRDPARAYAAAPAGFRGSYRIRAELDLALRRWTKGGAEDRTAAALRVADHMSGLVRYEMLRDLGRCVAMAAVDYLRERQERSPGALLIVDDELDELLSAEAETGRDRRLLTRLRGLVKLIGWDTDCSVIGSAAFRIDGEGPDHLGADRRLVETPLEVRLLADGTPASKRLGGFALILTEVESRHTYVGPNLVQRLAALLATDDCDETPGPGRREAAAAPILVLTRTESIGHIQQSLNLGADAYVLKERLFQLPMQMRRVLEGRSRQRDKTRRTSSFKKLKALRPEVRSGLLRMDGLGFVHGGFHQGRRLLIDKREENWIQLLPKADLHCHFGTCISYEAIRAIALNSVAYLLPPERQLLETDSFRRLVRTVVTAVVLAEWIQKTAFIEPMAALALAAGAVSREEMPKQLPRFSLGDKIVEWLDCPSERIQSFEVASLLVAVICTASGESAYPPSPRPDLDRSAPQDLFDHIARARGDVPDPAFHRAVATAGVEVDSELVAIVAAWGRDDTKPLVMAANPFDLEGGREHWERRAAAFRARLADADARLREERRKAWEELRRSGKPVFEKLEALVDRWGLCEPPERAVPGGLGRRLAAGPREIDPPASVPLGKYVQVRDDPYGATGPERGLQRYLRGADLLGAAHLQYPENLLIAAFAVALDNAADNVVYAELRCETTGYCQGGMNPYGATNLLCRALDLAGLLVAGLGGGGYPLTRTGLLLAAKRHKKKEAAAQVVMLMQHYLRRRGERPSPYSEPGTPQLPKWWAPCQVLGFDISGDEATNPPWLEKMLDPLAVLSSPITIHAGEAATADSIWRAVYRHHATRIGHGLRLREESRLMAYCVNEGICMEMCPNSNIFTNGFQATQGRYPQMAENPRSAYPLWEYLTKGLEVALGTDNRYLHQEGQQTLTSEYLAAARLSNGLTRWEILQLAKAGFKNAFLPKKEIQALLSAMEDRIYRIISRGWF